MKSAVRVLVVGLAALGGCSASVGGGDPGLEGLAVESVQPSIIVPGTTLVITGASFVGSPWGTSVLRLRSGGQEAQFPARYVSPNELAVDIDRTAFDLLGTGELTAEAVVMVTSGVDGHVYETAPLPVQLDVREELRPELTDLQDSGLVFVNDAIELRAAGLLLGGGEGRSVAVVSGCVRRGSSDAACVAIDPVEMPLVPATRFDRRNATFAFSPTIAGIEPGTFEGRVSVRNEPSTGAMATSGDRVVSYELIAPAVFAVSPTAASLGQWVDIRGGGFVGSVDGGATLLELRGSFSVAGSTESVAVELTLIPRVEAGNLARYIINEDDSLADAVDVRGTTGTFVGTMTPVVAWQGDEVIGDSAPLELAIEPVKQLVYLHFESSYVESLRHFGLRGVDAFIRERVASVVAAAYATVNLEVRLTRPDDYALYSEVQISGPDPNGLGLFGYDNTPGKDNGNERLYDRIGGVNAQTQEDGFPGYGGVFIESMFGFSLDPGAYAQPLPGADGLFDEIFDPFRPDRGGERVAARDLTAGLPSVAGGAACPATDRSTQIACAVHALGALIGTTVSHEIGHSLGLANPHGEGFHNRGDAPGRLMDAGGARPFRERAELGGAPPGRFCTEEYEYLRQILPSPAPVDTSARPPC